jgi:hypothetical protein
LQKAVEPSGLGGLFAWRKNAGVWFPRGRRQGGGIKIAMIWKADC